ncbi:Ribosomal protein S19 [Paragonimus heterotremus]|uniref:Small ribosomal subunit protein eS19 n=1 Tax=Paragonimus heterotremus TaxID=100268 RepID=A0A8J4TET1_9TREM|nr:Ribosomal protein S19 [Paragonimus heterotremus]
MAPTSVKDINGHVFVRALGEFLKKSGKVARPEWTDIVKLSAANESGPYDPDWFYIRCAAILRHLYLRPTGMKGFTRIFARKKSNGVKPSHRVLANESVIRRALQQLEAVGLCEKLETGGRTLTRAGRQDLDRLASKLKK